MGSYVMAPAPKSPSQVSPANSSPEMLAQGARMRLGPVLHSGWDRRYNKKSGEMVLCVLEFSLGC